MELNGIHAELQLALYVAIVIDMKDLKHQISMDLFFQAESAQQAMPLKHCSFQFKVC